jgi:hypothetical protein
MVLRISHDYHGAALDLSAGATRCDAKAQN